jgi:hypothetical protein
MAQAQNLVEYNNGVWEPKAKMYSVDLIRTGVVGATVQGIIQVDSSSPFIIDALHGEDSSDTTGMTVQTPFQVQIQDNESGYQWSDGWTSRSAFFGRRGWGRRVSGFQVVRPGTRITITLRDTVATAGTTTVSLEGRSLMRRA